MNNPTPKAILLAQNLRPKKSFGQNFMMDVRINKVLTDTVASFGKSLPIVEIGAGTGALTTQLLTISPLVHAVERDRDLIPLLKDQLQKAIDQGQLILHEADGAKFDIKAAVRKPCVLVGNLPYHLTSSIILLALKNRSILRGAVFLVQKEVADRLVAQPNNKQYGFLTVILKLAFDLQKIIHVDKSAFWPVPKVDSAIIKMTTADHGLSLVEDLEKFIVFVRAIFQKRRKKLSTIMADKISKERLIAMGIDPNLRPENLAPNQFLQIFLA